MQMLRDFKCIQRSFQWLWHCNILPSRACLSEQMFDLLRDCCLLGISGWMGWGAAWDSGIVLGIVDGGSGRGAQVHWTFTFNDFRENWVIAFAGAGHRHHGFGGNCRGGEVQSLHQESVNRLLGPLWGRALASCAVQWCKKAAGFLQISSSSSTQIALSPPT